MDAPVNNSVLLALFATFNQGYRSLGGVRGLNNAGICSTIFGILLNSEVSADLTRIVTDAGNGCGCISRIGVIAVGNGIIRTLIQKLVTILYSNFRLNFITGVSRVFYNLKHFQGNCFRLNLEFPLYFAGIIAASDNSYCDSTNICEVIRFFTVTLEGNGVIPICFQGSVAVFYGNAGFQFLAGVGLILNAFNRKPTILKVLGCNSQVLDNRTGIII